MSARAVNDWMLGIDYIEWHSVEAIQDAGLLLNAVFPQPPGPGEVIIRQCAQLRKCAKQRARRRRRGGQGRDLNLHERVVRQIKCNLGL